MPTHPFSATYLHTTDAEFRTWGSAVSAALANVATIAGDTGQINWVTVTRPGSSTKAGYEIWDFPCGLTAKVEYGTDITATRPAIWFQWGENSNGSGTLTGQLSTSSLIAVNPSITAGAKNSFLSSTTEHFLFVWAVDGLAAGQDVGHEYTEISTDADGVPDGDGYWTLRRASGSTWTGQGVRITGTLVTGSESIYMGSAPGSPTSSVFDGDNHPWPLFMAIPDMRRAKGAIGYVHSEIAKGGTFAHAEKGATSSTFLACGQLSGPSGPLNGGSSTYAIAFRYE